MLRTHKFLKKTAATRQAVFARNCVWLSYCLLSLLIGEVTTSAVQAQGIASGGVYKLRNQCSSKLLDVYGAFGENGTSVIQWSENNGLNQQWKVEATDSGFYKLTAQHAGGKALDVVGVGTTNGTAVQQWNYGGGLNQQWKITDVGSGYYKLAPRHVASKALDVSGASTADGARVQIWTDNSTCAQRWKFEAVGNTGETRDPWLWPFAQDSIWNMPIGSNAQYVDAQIGPAGWTGEDTDLLYKVPAGSPTRNIYDPYSWEQRCGGTAIADPNRRKTMPIPDNLVVPDADPPHTPNNASAFLLPDNETIVQLNPLARCAAGGPVYGWVTEDLSIRGAGIRGGHGGSGLSSIGGTIRLSELLGNQPIRHALKINLYANRYFAYNNDGTRGYRWPADRADGYAASAYRGTNPALEIGALLAIPPSVTEASLGLKTVAGRKLFRVLQDYGAYTVDDTAWDAHAIAVQQGVAAEFKQAYGLDFNGYTGDFHDDINALFGALSVVNNNAANNIGGGGVRRAPLAPPFR